VISRRSRCAIFARLWGSRVSSQWATAPKLPGCFVEQAVNAALGKAFDEAEALLLRQGGFTDPALFYAAFSFRGWLALA